MKALHTPEFQRFSILPYWAWTDLSNRQDETWSSAHFCVNIYLSKLENTMYFCRSSKYVHIKKFLVSDEMKGKVYHLVELDELYRMKLFATFDWVAMSERFLNNCVEKDRKTWSSIHYQKSWSSVRKCVDFFTKRFAVKFCIWRYTVFGNLSVGRLAFLPAPVLKAMREEIRGNLANSRTLEDLKRKLPEHTHLVPFAEKIWDAVDNNPILEERTVGSAQIGTALQYVNDVICLHELLTLTEITASSRELFKKLPRFTAPYISLGG